MTMKDWWLAWWISAARTAGVVALVVLAILAVTAHHQGPAVCDRDRVCRVPCPTQDCTVDWYDGAWYVGPPGSAR